VLHLAYGGADLDAVVSFHGSFPLPEPGTTIDPAVLVCHGARDGFTKPDKIQKWQDRMDQLDADWHMMTFAKAEHAFSNPAADAHGIDGISYNEKADERSWAYMQLFFDRRFDAGQTTRRNEGNQAAADEKLAIAVAANRLTVDGQVVSAESLEKHLTELNASRATTPVILTADAATRHKRVARVLAVCETAGFENVSIEARRGVSPGQ
jgi:hypothetical protein